MHDIRVAIQLSDPNEVILPDLGWIAIEDPETGELREGRWDFPPRISQILTKPSSADFIRGHSCYSWSSTRASTLRENVLAPVEGNA
jgi:hypothetical protein